MTPTDDPDARRVDVQRMRVHRRVRYRRARPQHIDGLVIQAVVQLGKRNVAAREMSLGVAAMQVMSDLRQAYPGQGRARPGWNTNPDRVPRRTLPGRLAGGLGMSKQRPGRLGKSQARGAHPQNPRRAALEKNHSELPFQALNSLRQGRRRQVQPRRGPSIVTFLRENQEARGKTQVQFHR